MKRGAGSPGAVRLRVLGLWILSRSPTDLHCALLLSCLLLADPFTDAVDKEDSGSAKDYVHIRIQQRNGKKSLTTIQVSKHLWFDLPT